VVGCEISNLSNFVAAKQLSAVVGQKNSSLLNFVKFRNEALWLVENYPTSQISQHRPMERSGWSGKNPTSSISRKKKLSALVG
jgi:hypothetical protein